jgi:phage shock protein A
LASHDSYISHFQDLKRKWEERQKADQLLPILTDTIPKRQHKTKLDEELKQLENDIKTIECHPDIYVTDTASTVFSFKRDSE